VQQAQLDNLSEPKETNFNDSVKMHTYKARANTLNDENKRHIEAFGKVMDEAGQAEYLANGKVKYIDYKTMKPKEKEQIGAQVELDRVVKELNEYSQEEIEDVSGMYKGSWLNETAKNWSGFNRYTARQNNLIQLLGKLDSEEMHKLYGAALTGTEAGRAAKWNFEKSQDSTKLIESINSLARANTAAIKNTKQGMINFPIKDYEYGRIFKATKEVSSTKVKKRNIKDDTNSSKKQAEVIVDGVKKSLILD